MSLRIRWKGHSMNCRFDEMALHHCVNLTFLSAWHFVNLAFGKLDISSARHFVSLTLCQLYIVSAWLLVNLTFGQLGIWSSWHLVKLAFGQLGIWSSCHFVNFTFGQLDIWSACRLVCLTFGQLAIHTYRLYIYICIYTHTQNKKRVLVQNKSNLILKIILYNNWTLQLFKINRTNSMETIYKG
jgi:hypothetical protein